MGMGLMLGTPIPSLAAWLERSGWHKLQKLALVIAVCVAILWALKLVGKAVRRAVDDGKSEITTDAERRADTLSAVLNNTARIVVVVFFLLMTLQEFGVNIQPLLAGSAVAGVALGFGAQALVKDVISGFFLLMENQFSVGDIISVDEKHVGTVERMTLRVTMVRDMEGKAHYLPNGSIVRVVVLSKEFARSLVDVEVGYPTDLDRAMDVLRAVGADLHLAMPDSVLEATEVKGVEALTPQGCVLRTLTKTAPGRQWDVARELRRRIVLRFREEGIEIPFPQRVVWNRSTEDPSAGE